jgi:hypothetical protein
MGLEEAWHVNFMLSNTGELISLQESGKNLAVKHIFSSYPAYIPKKIKHPNHILN